MKELQPGEVPGSPGSPGSSGPTKCWVFRSFFLVVLERDSLYKLLLFIGLNKKNMDFHKGYNLSTRIEMT